MPSFDVVSELDHHELRNAVDQANRELETRFDFRGANSKFELEGASVTFDAPSEFQLKQLLEILTLKVSKRGIDLVCMDPQDPDTNLARAKQVVLFKEGVDSDSARAIQKAIKESKLKVQAAIQGDKVRVTGKNRDDLQATIAMLRKQKLEVALQFNNFRD